MEAVVTGRPALRLLPPAGQAIGQGLPLFRGGEINDRGGAAPQGRPAAGGEVVGGNGARHMEIKVGVAVNKAGKEQRPGTVYHPGVPLGQGRPHRGHPLPLQQYVQTPAALAGDNRAALQQGIHPQASYLIQSNGFYTV